ncbi:MAG TPA: preprotein translocase subunit YajC [Candidatus Limnocylindria bacterium]|jgi:preprotein translocase subunit YajC|nr:preprotein translocase subunit YajC [Candidatus Limnocylindria bacterium]
MLPVPYYLFAMPGPPAGASPEEQKRSMLMQFGMIAFMVVIFYVMLIRPQQTQAKKQKELMSQLKKGDKIVTSSGIIGIVTNVTDDVVTIRSGETKLDLQKSAVSQVTSRSES